MSEQEAVVEQPAAETPITLPVMYRCVAVDMARGADGKMVAELSISSEAEVERRDFLGERSVEILSHDEGAVDLSRVARGMPLHVMDLDDYDDGLHHGKQVGILENIHIRKSDRKLVGVPRFSRNALGQEVQRDYEDGLRPYVSVGYRVKAARKVGVDPVRGPIYMATRWQPLESTFVSVPADVTVGKGRSGAEPNAVVIEPEAPSAGPGEAAQAPAPEPEAEKAAPVTAAITEVQEMDENKAPEAAARVAVLEDRRSEGQKSRDKEAAEIFDMCDQHGCGAMAARFVRDGLSVDQVSYEILKAKKTPIPEHAAPSAEELPMRPSDRRRYSYARAMQIGLGAAELSREGRSDFRFDGVEAEVHQEFVRRLGPPAHGGVYVPYDVRGAEDRWRAMEARTLDTKTPGKGPETVFDVVGPFIELLRARTVCMALGARVDVFGGPVSFPKQTAPGVAQWMGENPPADVPDSDMGLGLVQMVGKTLMGSMAYTRQLLGQSAVDIEGRTRVDLSAIHSRAIDRACIHGTGAAGQPTGIYKTPGVNSQPHGSTTPTYVNLVNMAALVADDSADTGALGWATTPLLAGKLKTVPEHTTGTMADWIWRGRFDQGDMVGYRGLTSGQLSKTMSTLEDTGGSAHALVYGNWNDLEIAMFGAFEIVVDPYTKKKRAIIEVTSYQQIDIAVLHAESFCIGTDATL